MSISGGRIYVVTFNGESRDGIQHTDVLIFTVSGKFIQKISIKLKMSDPLMTFPFTIHEEKIFQLAENVERQLGRLDGMIHCAAMLGMPTPFAQSDTEIWYKVHQVNLHAPYLLTRVCLPMLSRAERASLLFMTDDKPGAYWDAYQVSKRAMAAMAQLIAREYEGTGLRVNCFNPGKTKTALQLRAYPAAGNNDALPPPEAHADVFLYLMSDLAQEHGETFTAG